MPTLEAILRASGRVTGCRCQPPGQSVQHGQRQRPPRRERLIRRARQRDDRNFSNPADGGGSAGLQRDAMRDDLAALGQRRDRRIGAADAAAADGDERSHAPASIALAMDAASRAAASAQITLGAGRAGAFRDQLRRHRLARHRGNIDDAQARAAHIQSFQSRRARDQ